MTLIVSIRDVLLRREQQAREIEFYLEQKARLEGRLAIVRRELKLTDDILKLIHLEMEKK